MFHTTLMMSKLWTLATQRLSDGTTAFQAAVAILSIIGLSMHAHATQTLSKQVAIDWNEVMLRMEPNPNFIEHSRLGAMFALAIHDALNSIPEVKRYHTYFSEPLGVDGTGASAVAAVAAAGKAVALAYITDLRNRCKIDDNTFTTRGTVIDTQYNATMASVADQSAKDRGITLGQAAGVRMLHDRATDGWDPYGPPFGPPCHLPVPPAFPYANIHEPPALPLGAYSIEYPSFGDVIFTNPIRYWWGNLRPFALESHDQFRVEAPPAPDDEDFLQDLDRTRRMGGDAAHNTERTEDQSDQAQWWQSCNGTGYGAVSKILTGLIARDSDMDLVDASHALALMTMSMADGLIANINNKNVYNVWRPITAIRKLGYGTNWAPFLPTPPNQEYPAGHPMVSGGAGLGIVKLIFKDRDTGLDKTLDPELVVMGFQDPFVQTPFCRNSVRSFSSIDNAIDSVIMARVYGGMHFLHSGKIGEQTGRHLAKWIYNHFLLPLDN